MSIIRIFLFAFIAIVVGLVGLSLLFADLAPGESFTSRLVALALLLFFSGIAIGFFNARVWYLSGLVAWGSILLGATGLLTSEGNSLEALSLLILPLCLTLISGYAGSVLNKKRVLQRLFKR